MPPFQIGKDYESPSGGTVVLDDEGYPTGQLFEGPAIMLVGAEAPLPSEEAMVNGFLQMWRAYASAGLTTITDLAYMPTPELDELLKQMADAPNFPVRLGELKYNLAKNVNMGNI